MRLFIISALVVILDQLTKLVVVSTMETGQSFPVINDFLYFTYVRNPGAAFGMFPYQTALLIAVTVVVMVFIIYYYRILPPGFDLMRVGLALQLGGAVGNLIDRLHNTCVVDFIDFTIFPPVFNLADTALVVGIVLFLFSFLKMSYQYKGS